VTSVDTLLQYEIAGERYTYPIERLAVCRIGRGGENSIVIQDGLSSREHAMIRRNAMGHCILTDLGSRNGTRLNGRPITTPTSLADGDIVQIGKQMLVFSQPVAPPSLVSNSQASAAATQFVLDQALMTVLVMDIRGYTILSQVLGEQRISEMMADVFHAIGEILNRQQSWSQKYIGDAVMAVWVHNDDYVPGVELLRVFDTISEFREMLIPFQRKYDLLNPLKFGCGINTGYASVGNMGSSAAADFTALGDSVNKAFRLETATKELGIDILIGTGVLDALRPPLPPADLPEPVMTELKGYAEPVPAFPLRLDDLGKLSSAIIANETRR
jgi:adenylate cyclase